MIGTRGARFVDESGRTLLLRGVNLAGSSKVPFEPDGSTHRPDGLRGHRRVSFVGRPFPLDQADEHFGRMRSWGFTLVRLLVPWEAVEHAGPGQYDEPYLGYLHEVVRLAGRYGISVFIDPHQDMWSRFSGGDGAPGWTLETAGFDLGTLDATGAAVTHQAHGDPMPRVLWVTNGGKLAAATMFTLFFGGADFAPRTTVDGRSIQDFLQESYVAAFSRVARALVDLPNVVGFGIMNEPLCGYIGWRNLTTPQGQLTLGDGPTPLQGMALGAGIPQTVGVWTMGLASIRRTGRRILNPGGLRAWAPGRECPWQVNGVWEPGADGQPVLLRPDHFAVVRGHPVDFSRHYFLPFAERFAAGIRSASPRALIFLEAEAGAAPPPWDHDRFPGTVFAPHWYDDLTLVKNRYFSFAALDSTDGAYRPVLGRRAIHRSFRAQLLRFPRLARERIGEVPTILAEFGIPFSMQKARAYRTGRYRAQEAALDRSFRAIESALMSFAIWNYTPDNTNSRGDRWNAEDLSIFSRDQQTEPSDVDSGGRALSALLRPWPRATAGQPLRMVFDRRRRLLRYEFRHDPAVCTPTEIYVPRWQFPSGFEVRASDGSWEARSEEQLLLFRHDTQVPDHWIEISPPRRPASP